MTKFKPGDRVVFVRKEPVTNGYDDIPIIKLGDVAEIVDLTLHDNDSFRLNFIHLTVEQNHWNGWWENGGRFISESIYNSRLYAALQENDDET